MGMEIAGLATCSILIVAQLSLLHVFSGRLDRVLHTRFGTSVYLCIAFPGTVIHELSHLAGCLLTRTRVHEVRPFSPRMEGDRFVLGFVRHDRPRGPVSSFIIGTAPFWGGAAALWLAASLLIPEVFGAARQAMSHGTAESAFVASVSFVAGLLRSLSAADWRAWVMLYLLVSIPIHLAPSSDDLKNAAWGIVFVSAAVVTVAALSFRFGWSFSGPVFGRISSLSAVLVGLLTFALFCCTLASIAVWASFRLIRRRT